MKTLLIILLLFPLTAICQDTTGCYLRIIDTVKRTVTPVEGYEITRFEKGELIHVAYLDLNKRRFRLRKNECIVFFESKM